MKFKEFGPIVQYKNYEMPEKIALAIDEAKTKYNSGLEYKRKEYVPSEFSIEADDRSDISVITSNSPDRDGEVVLPHGMIRDIYDANPVVCWSHDYKGLPIGKSMWTKLRDNDIIAKTKYATTSFGEDVWQLVKNDMLRAKSAGFLPLSERRPTSEELNKHPNWKGCNIVDKSILFEYSCCVIPANADALTIMTSKCKDKDLIARLKSIKVPEIKPVFVPDFCTCGKVLIPHEHYQSCKGCETNYFNISGQKVAVKHRHIVNNEDKLKLMQVKTIKEINEKIQDEVDRILGIP